MKFARAESLLLLGLVLSGCAGDAPEADSAASDSMVAKPTSAVTAPSVSEPRPDSAAESATEALRNYFRAVNAGDFEAAYLSWSDSGRASGQTLDEFTEGYRHTTRVDPSIGPAGRVEGAAGSRYVEIPVLLDATTDGGEEQHFSGSYVMRRAVVDGATPSQRAWHIFSADMREVEG